MNQKTLPYKILALLLDDTLQTYAIALLFGIIVGLAIIAKVS